MGNCTISGLPRACVRAGFTVAIAAVLFAGCSSGASVSSPTTTTPSATSASVDTLAPPTVHNGATATVDAIDNDYRAKHLEVKAGTKVTFVNAGHNLHDIVPNDPKTFDFGVTEADFKPGDSSSFTFAKPGTYAYYCSLHATANAGSMRGVITVTK